VAEGFSIAEGFVEIASRIDSARNRRNAEKAGDEAGGSFITKMGTKLIAGIGGTILPAFGAVLQLGLAAAPAVAAVGTAIWQVASAAGAAAPALLAIGVAAGLVKLTLTAIAPAIGKALSPIKTSFEEATKEASKLATVGVRPLAKEFAKVNMPAVALMMNMIAKATNGVVRETVGWLNTTRGQQAILQITSATGEAVKRLGPNLSSVATSFVAMIGRISGVSLAAGERGLSGVLHKLEILMDRVTAETVQSGLDRLRAMFDSVRNAVQVSVHWIGIAVGLYRQYKTEIMLISDALGILAIVFGGPVTAIIALVGLVIRHFGTLQAVYQSLMAAFQNSTQGPAFLNNLKAAADIVIPVLVNGFRSIWATIGPILERIFKQIMTQLVPAFGEFVLAMAPLVAFFIQRLVPVIKVAMSTILNVISGVITIVTGIFKVFTGILTGNWSKTWAGIKQILRGAVQVLVAIVRGLVGLIRAGLANLGAILSGIFSRAVSAAIRALSALPGKARAQVGRLKSSVTGALSGAGSWLVNAGQRIISGLISGIRNKIGELRNTLGGITNLIPDWKGPAERDAKLLTPAGQKIMRGLMGGVASQIPAFRKQLGGLTGDIPGMTLSGAVTRTSAASAAAGAATKRSAGGGVSIGELHVHLQGMLDPTNPTAARKLAAQLYELLHSYEKSYA
jgi:phage-related protein